MKGQTGRFLFHLDNTRVVITGCSFRRKHFGTVNQFKRHISEDVLPPLLDKLSTESEAER